MTVPNNLLMYDDVRQPLERALEEPIGLRIELPSRGLAVSFRQRAYKYRKALQRISMQSLAEDDPNYGFTPFDALAITIESNFVIIKHRENTILKMESLTEDDL